ncbi:cell division protein ZapE [Pelagibacteraceae bacterium]|nr:cell division protein ZapE [Pelagibacteraceae bacterium]
MSSLKDSFLNYCTKNSYEKNLNQLMIIDFLIDFLDPKLKFLNLFSKKKNKKCFYLYGGVGVGKTMILNFVYDFLYIPKQRLHFNEFMINFHNYRYKNKKKDNSIIAFVKNLKKYKLIYLDEFQVTNIVDAMILGKLFETIFNEGIKLILTSNIKPDDLYKDGLQREKFLPFISIIKENSFQKELIIEDDYRKLGPNKLMRVFYPVNEKNIFKINQIFRELTKNKKNKKIELNIKGRNFIIQNFYEGVARFNFKDLCDLNIGAVDYLEIAKICKFIVIENIPKFNNENSNQQNRFITLIDILYENKITLLISISSSLDNLGSSNNLKNVFQRTLSRLYEMTSPKVSI